MEKRLEHKILGLLNMLYVFQPY